MKEPLVVEVILSKVEESIDIERVATRGPVYTRPPFTDVTFVKEEL